MSSFVPVHRCWACWAVEHHCSSQFLDGNAPGIVPTACGHLRSLLTVCFFPSASSSRILFLRFCASFMRSSRALLRAARCLSTMSCVLMTVMSLKLFKSDRLTTKPSLILPTAMLAPRLANADRDMAVEGAEGPPRLPSLWRGRRPEGFPKRDSSTSWPLDTFR